jgi:tRNA/rRNA methyltransferase
MTGGPVIILVRPQLAENIGASARAMWNCGLTRLRIVRPRCAWPHPKAVASATGAATIIENAMLFNRLEDAIADLNHVYATCPRLRDMVKPVVDHHTAAVDLRAQIKNGETPGVLFGPERTGLENDEVALADTHLRIPLNPEFDSMNLAHAVLAVGLAWWDQGAARVGRTMRTGKAQQATKQELLGLFERLEGELERCGFLRDQHLRPTMVRNLRAIFQRAGLMAHEIRTLHGVITGLTERPHAPREPGANASSGNRRGARALTSRDMADTKPRVSGPARD